jgi:hypothetical protein
MILKEEMPVIMGIIITILITETSKKMVAAVSTMNIKLLQME